ncbi:L-threonylcarbamoyladenylate synthase [Thiomicrorhabdus heinhorstiae]|uniref:Threonylcarbamoyl-AMP synthase n=1 Tax=Thiomicrorhabdus heinhorstiae TaxID=2748010 RepID=A0ABS0C1F9_9GAMM|nr:L-threonylcarbamoyladenylate synthase [Thiomicrorhabdus heinhorstiae]MBF6058911.1 threonylcarbamoyl-AMP synthase [Thiomicrorhabdus heinhorstiae]
MQDQNPHLNPVETAVERLREGGVIAYPTEAVYGLGCDPFDFSAVEKVFHVKQRPIDKGLILVAASVEQVVDYVELAGMPWEEKVLATWPGPVTWVLPTKKNIPEWITGGRDTLAIRVSAHPIVQQLCTAYGKPMVSTSANLTSQPPAKSCEEIERVFGGQVFCVPGELGNLSKPTQIIDAQSGTVLR